MQQRLHETLASSLPEALRGARYNYFAHPDPATDQNSAAWVDWLMQLITGADPETRVVTIDLRKSAS